MISQENYNKLLEGFWDVASWAMWLPPVADRPKSNVGNLKIFKDPELLTKINTGFVYRGFSGGTQTPWGMSGACSIRRCNI